MTVNPSPRMVEAVHSWNPVRVAPGIKVKVQGHRGDLYKNLST